MRKRVSVHQPPPLLQEEWPKAQRGNQLGVAQKKKHRTNAHALGLPTWLQSWKHHLHPSLEANLNA